MACLVDGFGEFDVQAASRLSIGASDAQSIADMFLHGVVTDWVECGGDPDRAGFPGGKRLEGLGLDPSVPNMTVVYTGDRFFRV